MANNFDSVASLLLNSGMRIVLPFACVTSTPGILWLFTKSVIPGFVTAFASFRELTWLVVLVKVSLMIARFEDKLVLMMAAYDTIIGNLILRWWSQIDLNIGNPSSIYISFLLPCTIHKQFQWQVAVKYKRKDLCGSLSLITDSMLFFLRLSFQIDLLTFIWVCMAFVQIFHKDLHSICNPLISLFNGWLFIFLKII